jgi:hypothetical protein
MDYNIIMLPAGNRLCFLCKPKPPLMHFNHKAVTGGSGSITSLLFDFIKHLQHSLSQKIKRLAKPPCCRPGGALLSEVRGHKNRTCIAHRFFAALAEARLRHKK